MLVASEDDISISEDGLVRVAGVPLGRIVEGCLVFKDRHKYRVQARGGDDEVGIPLVLLQRLTRDWLQSSKD